MRLSLIKIITPRSYYQVDTIVAMCNTALSGALSRQSLVIIFVSVMRRILCSHRVVSLFTFYLNPFIAQMALSTSTRMTSQESPAAAAKPMCMSVCEKRSTVRTEMKCGIDRDFQNQRVECRTRASVQSFPCVRLIVVDRCGGTMPASYRSSSCRGSSPVSKAQSSTHGNKREFCMPASPADDGFEKSWEILQNSRKPTITRNGRQNMLTPSRDPGNTVLTPRGTGSAALKYQSLFVLPPTSPPSSPLHEANIDLPLHVSHPPCCLLVLYFSTDL